MRFRLHFTGELKANDVRGKSIIRKHFSSQLSQLWHQLPLSDIRKFAEPKQHGSDFCIRRELGNAVYIPVACTKLATIAELDILLLRPGQPGDLLHNGADLDNRLKTLLDALQPPHSNALNSSDEEGDIYCLVEDDKLITRLNIETDRLLEHSHSENRVVAIIGVEIRPTRGLTVNHALLC